MNCDSFPQFHEFHEHSGNILRYFELSTSRTYQRDGRDGAAGGDGRDVSCLVLTSVLYSSILFMLKFSFLGIAISVVQTVSFTFQASLGDS